MAPQQLSPRLEVLDDIASEVGPAVLLLAFLSHLDKFEVVESFLDEVELVSLELEKVTEGLSHTSSVGADSGQVNASQARRTNP